MEFEDRGLGTTRRALSIGRRFLSDLANGLGYVSSPGVAAGASGRLREDSPMR